MLNLEDVTKVINEHVMDEEAKAAIGVALLEANLPDPDTSELDNLRAELENERNGRAADKANYVERINKFIYGGDPGPGPEPEVKEELEVEEAVEIKDPYEELYGGNE